MKKFLTIALLVMALCVVSVAVSAAPTASCSNGVATVKADKATAAGQTVVLVVKENERPYVDKTALADASTENLELDIIYVDQATVSVDEEKSFTFVPRSYDGTNPYVGEATVFLSNGVDDPAVISLYTGETYTVTLNANGGECTTASLKVQDNETKSLETIVPTKVGYEFDGWFDDDTKVESIVGAELRDDLTLTAKWTPNYEAPESSADIDTDATVEGAGKLADVRTYDDNGVEKYQMSVSTKITAKLKEKKILGFGFHVFNAAKSKVITVTNEGEEAIAALKNGDGFYAVASGITKANADEQVGFKAFVITEVEGVKDVAWSENTFYSVNGLLAQNQ